MTYRYYDNELAENNCTSRNIERNPNMDRWLVWNKWIDNWISIGRSD